ncbi:MAG: Hsp70 family protein, partial [Fibrobacter sp.]|nr:Hsp70 family protein [Fibrobacter sp.]
PSKKSQIFSTAADNQTAVTIMVYQGEREMAAHNRLLGKFDLLGLPPAPRGVPQIEVSFDIDANGILNVSAKDMGTGKQQQIRIESSSGLSDNDIQRMVNEAEQNAARDKEEKEKIEIKNQGDQLVYQTEKMLTEVGDKISADDKAKITAALDDLKEKVKSDNTEAIKGSIDALTKASHAMAEQLYKNASAAGAAGAAGPQPGPQAQPEEEPKKKGKDDGAVDADYEIVD